MDYGVSNNNIITNNKLNLLSQAVDLLKKYAEIDLDNPDILVSSFVPQPTSDGQTLISTYNENTQQYEWVIHSLISG